jgi:hypothetical protein
VERALPFDREFMARSNVAIGQAALCHYRGLEPGIVGHRDILESYRRCKSLASAGFLPRSS